jgi:hypothetical protein
MTTSNLKGFVYLNSDQYTELVANGQITVNGTTITYDRDAIYITEDDTPVEAFYNPETGIISAKGLELNGIDINTIIDNKIANIETSGGITEEEFNALLEGKIPEQACVSLVGTEEKPINFATDILDNKIYILQGPIKYSDNRTVNFDSIKTFVQKAQNYEFKLYGIHCSGGS